MVTVIDFVERRSSEGEEFFALVVQGGIEMVKSQETGRFYATARKASVPSTFDEAFCHKLIGQEIPGEIRRVEVEPYSFVIPETEEEITLTHSYMFVPEGEELEIVPEAVEVH